MVNQQQQLYSLSSQSSLASQVTLTEELQPPSSSSGAVAAPIASGSTSQLHPTYPFPGSSSGIPANSKQKLNDEKGRKPDGGYSYSHSEDTEKPGKKKVVDSHQKEVMDKTRKKVITVLGQCLLQSGCPCHRAEEALQHTARMLAVDASFSFLPDTAIVTFSSDPQKQSFMIKSPQSLDMGRIGRTHAIMDRYFEDADGAADDLARLEECLAALEEVANSGPTWGMLGTLFAFGASSFSASVMLFEGSWIDASLSAGLGLVVALMFILASYYPIYGRVFEISACVLVAALARALHSYCCFTGVAVSGILILLPGYGMTVSVMELSARHVTTGSIRLVYAIFYAFLLAYGLQMGSRLYASIVADDSEVGNELCGSNPVSPWYYIPMLPVLSISIAISYGSSVRQWASQSGGAAIAFCLSYFLGKVVPDPPIVNSITAFATGLYAYCVLKLTGEPPLISLSVGITLLVPGSIGVKGAYSLLHQESPNDSLFPIQMAIVALGLAAGMFAAAMIVYPAGKGRKLLISL